MKNPFTDSMTVKEFLDLPRPGTFIARLWRDAVGVPWFDHRTTQRSIDEVMADFAGDGAPAKRNGALRAEGSQSHKGDANARFFLTAVTRAAVDASDTGLARAEVSRTDSFLHEPHPLGEAHVVPPVKKFRGTLRSDRKPVPHPGY